jgi:hypothetical protein
MKCDTTRKFLLPTTIYHFSTLGIVWSLFVVGPPTDEFLKNALVHDPTTIKAFHKKKKTNIVFIFFRTKEDLAAVNVFPVTQALTTHQ